MPKGIYNQKRIKGSIIFSEFMVQFQVQPKYLIFNKHRTNKVKNKTVFDR
jgi:hypothetical protein